MLCFISKWFFARLSWSFVKTCKVLHPVCYLLQLHDDTKLQLAKDSRSRYLELNVMHWTAKVEYSSFFPFCLVVETELPVLMHSK
jgi:hypothetical protein